jgi:predicted O-methyltransferase YrrM
MLSKLIDRMRAINALVLKYRDTEPVMELVYRDLFLRELKETGIEDVFYPVGASGNHSLLYFIARCLRELPLQQVVELGAGQSTLLLSRVKTAIGGSFEITTIEHEPFWVRDLKPVAGHTIVHAPLKPKSVGGLQIEYYDHYLLSDGPAIDFLVIDGPPAFADGRRFHRMGCLDIIEQRVKDDFVIVVDDAERKGEQTLGSSIRAIMQKRGCDYRETRIKAMKSQSSLPPAA